MEPDNGNALTFETDYQYDALGNLKLVTQNGLKGQEVARIRSFSYDSLSRLLTATNPENGMTAYSYDANSNVSSKVDARTAIAGGVWYCYDSLNRLTGKAYTQQGCPLISPAVVYSYDTSSLSGPGKPNTKGQLTAEQVIMNGAIFAERQPYQYDSEGRLQYEQQCTIGNCAGTPNTLSYTYDTDSCGTDEIISESKEISTLI